MYTQLQKSTAAYEVKSPELGAVMHARKHGLTIPERSVVAFVITKKGNSISEKAQVAELARDYDADYYVNNQVLPAVLKILGALGVDEEDIKTKGTQSRLGGWG
jgi:DNA polymerase I